MSISIILWLLYVTIWSCKLLGILASLWSLSEISHFVWTTIFAIFFLLQKFFVRHNLILVSLLSITQVCGIQMLQQPILHLLYNFVVNNGFQVMYFGVFYQLCSGKCLWWQGGYSCIYILQLSPLTYWLIKIMLGLVKFPFWSLPSPWY